MGLFRFHGCMGAKVTEVLRHGLCSGGFGATTAEMAAALRAAPRCLPVDDDASIEISSDLAIAINIAKGYSVSQASANLGAMPQISPELLARSKRVEWKHINGRIGHRGSSQTTSRASRLPRH